MTNSPLKKLGIVALTLASTWVTILIINWIFQMIDGLIGWFSANIGWVIIIAVVLIWIRFR